MKINSMNFHRRLLNWYDRCARDLPWRRTRDPYKIWVSEIMLQQTQVKTVIPYYQKWVSVFPDIRTLAAAEESRVLRHWAGLGYYRRAKMLHQGARYLAQQHESKLPETASALQAIPGIGRYTAGAIASIAFGQKAPVLDGNVMRVLTRLFAMRSDIHQAKTREQLWQLAESLMPGQRTGDYNQALMELGATVCTPQNPQCGHCPLQTLCRAYRQNEPEKFPVNGKPVKVKKQTHYALVLRKKNHVLLKQQQAHERWPGFWTFPFWDSRKHLLQSSGLFVKDLKTLMSLRHTFTHHVITLKVLTLKTPDHAPRASEQGQKQWKHSRWVSLKRAVDLPFPAPHQRVLDELRKDLHKQ